MSALTGIVKRFIEGGLKEDPAYLAEMTDAVMRYHIRQSLELLREMKLFSWVKIRLQEKR